MGQELSLVLRQDSLMTKMMLKQESQVIEHIQEEKVEINLPINQMGDSLLHYAAYKSMKRLIEYLLERSADPNLPNNRFLTPIDVAVPEVREWMIRTHRRLEEERAIAMARRSPKAGQQEMMMMESKVTAFKKE